MNKHRHGAACTARLKEATAACTCGWFVGREVVIRVRVTPHAAQQGIDPFEDVFVSKLWLLSLSLYRDLVLCTSTCNFVHTHQSVETNFARGTLESKLQALHPGVGPYLMILSKVIYSCLVEGLASTAKSENALDRQCLRTSVLQTLPTPFQRQSALGALTRR